MGGASLPPTAGAVFAVGMEKPWRERPRCARPTWPRACPEGSLTPWRSLSLQVVGDSMFGGEKRRLFAESNVLDYDSDLPDDPVPFVRKMLPANWSRSRLPTGQLLSWKWWLARAELISTCGRRQVIILASRQRRRPSRRQWC